MLDLLLCPTYHPRERVSGAITGGHGTILITGNNPPPPPPSSLYDDRQGTRFDPFHVSLVGTSIYHVINKDTILRTPVDK